ncbi:hypothetical protein [Streptomyces roseifaciens]|uniref:hypothetical protein n=1 Tax=Streptomyces roseifaciens TaxID=1488406 RepID=UPI00071826E5|nr:hypothetical protein [Streptomyces roseifaciens]
MTPIRRRRRRRHPVRSTAAAALVCVLAALFLLFVTVPDKRADSRAFATAPACVGDEPALECRKVVEGAVKHTETAPQGKTTHYWLTFTGRDGSTHHADMNGPLSVFAKVKPGDKVRATYWRGKIRFVDFRGTVQLTADQPKDAYRLPFACGLGLLVLGATFAGIAYWMVRHSPRAPERYTWQTTVPTCAGVLIAVVAFVAALVTDTVPTALTLTGAGAVPVALGASWRVRVRRRPAESGLAPVVPGKEKRFEGGVAADTPYGAELIGPYLVAGPGLLAVTPDPAGRTLRRALPRTLVVEGVRVPHRSDPARVTAEARGRRKALRQVVVVCRDGHGEVLIGVQRKHAPWVLGALQEPAPGGAGAQEPVPLSGYGS